MPGRKAFFVTLLCAVSLLSAGRIFRLSSLAHAQSKSPTSKLLIFPPIEIQPGLEAAPSSPRGPARNAASNAASNTIPNSARSTTAWRFEPAVGPSGDADNDFRVVASAASALVPPVMNQGSTVYWGGAETSLLP